MPLIYQYTEDYPSVPRSFQVEEESDSWWYGVQKSVACCVLAAAMSVSAQASTQVFWQGDEQLPSPHIEEIYQWDLSAPTIAKLTSSQQWEYQDEQIVPQPVAFTPDEDYWFNPMLPMPDIKFLNYPYFSESEEFLPTPPTPGTVLWLPYWGVPMSRLMRG